MTYGFNFALSGLGPSQGAIAPAEQFFEGSHAEQALARETGQNSIDAQWVTNVPVTLTFELARMSTDDVPGIDQLRSHLRMVERATRGSQGHERMEQALETAMLESISVLRIGDTGTKGLLGSESVKASSSPLSALTRGAGISAADGTRGGSFGIGSAVGPLASLMCTVLYTSLPIDNESVLLAGHSRLASHADDNGMLRVGDGFFTNLNVSDDFEYQRDPPAIGPFAPRTIPGTDIYILGYRREISDPLLRTIRDALVSNFMIAFNRGHLIAKGVANGELQWLVDQDTLEHHASTAPESLAFFRALNDPTPIRMVSQRFGTVSLYINIDDSLPKTLHTITVRKPLMRIATLKHNIPARYAAILECSDDRGNSLLRELEPPQHDRWDAARAPGGSAALTELKTFVRDGLRSRVKQQIGDQLDVSGLARYLPSAGLAAQDFEAGAGRRPSGGAGSEIESSTIQGRPGSPVKVLNPQRRTVRVTPSVAATADGADPAAQGRHRGGQGHREGAPSGIEGTAAPRKGSSRIKGDQISFRSWSDDKSGDICIALTSDKSVSGDLELVALGPGGSAESDYQLPIVGASEVIDGLSEQLVWSGNILEGVKLRAGVTSLVRLAVPANHRYRLGVK
jgi:hypothetical protein